MHPYLRKSEFETTIYANIGVSVITEYELECLFSIFQMSLF